MSEPLPRLIVVEDNSDIRTELVAFFTLRGYPVRGVEDGAALDRALNQEKADVAILDVLLPDENGIEIAKRLRANHTMGIVMLTCMAGQEDHINGLEAGADAYLVKGADLLVIEATINSLWRRMQRNPLPLGAGNWELDNLTWTLTAPNGRACKLTSMEKLVLERLFQTAGQVVSRSALVAVLGKEDSVTNRRNLDVLILRLRHKISEETGIDLPVDASYGRGLVFNAAVEMV